MDSVTSLLEGMKEKLEKAKSRLANAQQAFQVAQAELQFATAEFGIWTSALNLATRDEEKRVAESKAKQIPMDLPGIQAAPSEASSEEFGGAEQSLLRAIESSAEITNQTERVRAILRAHNTGMTPGNIWDKGRDHISSRAYLYAILKRLRDSDEVLLRRGKYSLKVKSIEVREGAAKEVVIQ